MYEWVKVDYEEDGDTNVKYDAYYNWENLGSDYEYENGLLTVLVKLTILPGLAIWLF